MTAVPNQGHVEARLHSANIEDWLHLWQAEQGPAKPAALGLMAGVIPMPTDARMRVLDLCCGPDDVGRPVRARFPNADVDGVDRDLFLISFCRAANQFYRISGDILCRDLDTPGWDRDLAGPYDVVAVANALHWFTLARVRPLLAEILSLLRPGGTFLLMEPVCAMPPMAVAFDSWKAAQPPQHQRQDWLAFWSWVNSFLGYDHIDLGGSPPAGRIDDGLTVIDWIGLVRDAGFGPIDVILRNQENVVVAAVKPDDGPADAG